MRKRFLSERQKVMTDAASALSPADEAAGWAETLIRKAHRGPGDTLDAAMHRVSRAYDIDRQTLWRLRYRRPRDVLASVYLKIKAAHDAECARQEAKLRHEIEITRTLAQTPARRALVAEAEAVLEQAEGPQGRATAQPTREGDEP